jgi:hypothetical protein
MQTLRRAVLGFVLVGLLDISTAVAAPGVVFQISVAPQPDEDVGGPCRYELVLLDPLAMHREHRFAETLDFFLERSGKRLVREAPFRRLA